MTMCKQTACIVHVYRPACTCIYIVHVHVCIITWCFNTRMNEAAVEDYGSEEEVFNPEPTTCK